MRVGWIVALLPVLAVPDFLPIGHKGVHHDIVLLWDEAALPWQFVVSPADRNFGNQRIHRGEPFAFSTKYGTRILAAPPDATLPPPKERITETDWANAPLPVRQVRSIGVGHPLARVETTLRIVAVENGTISFERVAEHRFDKTGRELGDLEWLPLCLIAAGGGYWIWRLDRAAGPRAAAP